MSDYRNLRIRTIEVPDEEHEGVNLILEVVETCVLKTTVEVTEGMRQTTESLYFVCIDKTEGHAQRLFIISTENSETNPIYVRRYDHENQEQRGRSTSEKGNQRTTNRGGNNPSFRYY